MHAHSTQHTKPGISLTRLIPTHPPTLTAQLKGHTWMDNASSTEKAETRVVVSAYVNYRHLAEIIIWAKENGLEFKNRSSIIRTVVNIFHGMLKNAGQIPIDVPEDRVLEVLSALGIACQRKNSRALQQLHQRATEMGIEQYLQHQAAMRFLESTDSSTTAPAMSEMDIAEMRKQLLAGAIDCSPDEQSSEDSAHTRSADDE